MQRHAAVVCTALRKVRHCIVACSYGQCLCHRLCLCAASQCRHPRSPHRPPVGGEFCQRNRAGFALNVARWLGTFGGGRRCARRRLTIPQQVAAVQPFGRRGLMLKRTRHSTLRTRSRAAFDSAIGVLLASFRPASHRWAGFTEGSSPCRDTADRRSRAYTWNLKWGGNLVRAVGLPPCPSCPRRVYARMLRCLRPIKACLWMLGASRPSSMAVAGSAAPTHSIHSKS